MLAAGEVPAVSEVVFLLDVDNTLLDNDRFAAVLGARLEQGFGTAGRNRYWALYAKLRDQLGYADYLGALQAFRAGLDQRVLGARLTTVFVRQGHYAIESADTAIDPPPDLGIERIGELIDFDLSHFPAVAPVRAAAPTRSTSPQEQA